MKRLSFLLFIALSSPASADLRAAVEDHILPGMSAFAASATALDAAAQADCLPASVRPAYQSAFDAWMGVADIRLGPSETAAISIAFWPDDRGFTAKTLRSMVADEDPVGLKPAEYGEVSVAARGFFALDMLLYDPAFADYTAGSYTCHLVQTVATELAAQAVALDADWQDGFAQVLLNAGDADNPTYFDRSEAVRALYTQLLGGLEFTADSRLGRPMGTYDRSRPKRAEAWRSGRSLRNAVLSAEAASAFAHALSDQPLPETDRAMAKAEKSAAHVADPSFQDITDPQARLRLEVLQQAVNAMRHSIETEIGLALGIAPGFNSQDGD